MQTDNYSSPFLSAVGQEVYSKISSTLDKYCMHEMIHSGVVLGLSGGADSVFLAYFLAEYRSRSSLPFSIVAVHINHCIRGAEADRDEEFSRVLAASLGLEFISFKLDVPTMARENGLGIEEMARNARYAKFREIIESRTDLSAIAVAHNATDNVETVLFNIVRGSGLAGATGIHPVRDNILRPLIELSKSTIVEFLDKSNCRYMLDSTNGLVDYSRNYIRHSVLPMLSRLNSSYEAAISSFSESISQACDFIDSSIRPLYKLYVKLGYLPLCELLSLHSAALARLIIILAKENGVKNIEKSQIQLIIRLLAQDNFKVTLSSGISFVAERGRCRFISLAEKTGKMPSQRLISGENKINGYNGIIYIDEIVKSSSNVYKIFIQADLSSAIIEGELYCRARDNGDAYFFGGMTHKLKKIFNDKGIPPSLRDRIPVICDEKGIVWVPGLPVRDDYKNGKRGPSRPISFVTLHNSQDQELYSASTDALE